MKKLLALLLLCIPAFGTTTFTGHIGTLGTTSVTTGSFVRFWLRGCGGNQPRVGGLTVIAPSQGAVFFFDFKANSSGDVTGTLYSNRDVTGLTDGEIECGGSHTSTWYGMQIFYAGKGGPEIPMLAKSTDTFDISSVTPLSTAPVVTAPDGDSTYARLDAGNQPFTGSLTVGGNIKPDADNTRSLGDPTHRWIGYFSALSASSFSPQSLDSIRFADQFTGSDCGAKINAADAALSTTAGEIWVNQACGTAWTTAVSLSASHILRFIQGGTYTTTNPVTLTGDYSGIIGAGTGEGGQLTVIKAANSASLNNVISMPGNVTVLHDLTVDGNRAGSGMTGGTGTGKAIKISGAGGRQDITRVTVQNSSGDGLYISGGCCAKIDRLFANANAGDGLFISGIGDEFIISSEFEGNAINGIELSDAPAVRIEHSDIGGNGTAGAAGKGIKIYGTAAGGHSSYEIITGNQFGNNYNEDIVITGFDSVGANYAATQSTIVGNSFIGSSNRTIGAVASVAISDGHQHQIVGNWFNSDGRTTYGIRFTETAGGRSVPSVLAGNSFNQAFNTGLYDDSTLSSKTVVTANGEGTTGFFRFGPKAFLQNNNGLYWKDSGGTPRTVIFLGADDTTYLWGQPTTKRINFQANPGTTSFAITATGVEANAAGFKHIRGTGGCATAASAGATCTATVTWGTAFADTSYTAICTGEGITSGIPLNGGLTAKAAGTVTFQTVAATAVAAQFTNINCTAAHD